MRKLSIVICALIFPLCVTAQRMGLTTVNKATFGIKGGVNLASMQYTDNHLSSLPQKQVFKPIGGIFIDIPINDFIGMIPEVSYVERGMMTTYKHYSTTMMSYDISARYVDLRIPFLLGINVFYWIQPYLVAGVDAGYLLGGNIHLKQVGMPNPEISIPIGTANMFGWYLGDFAGLVLRFFGEMNGQRAQFKIDAVYNYGFLDSFSNMEHADVSAPMNVNAYNTTGERFPKGIELTIGLAIPLTPDKNDACYSFSRDKWMKYY